MSLPTDFDFASLFEGLLPDAEILEERIKRWQAWGNLLRRLARIKADVDAMSEGRDVAEPETLPMSEEVPS